MRYIPIHTFEPSAEWKTRAKQATVELQAIANLNDRLEYIKRHAAIWKDLGKELIDHFGNKCWYTDASNYGARLDVEHFRPKAKTIELTVKDCNDAENNLLLKLDEPNREGYWWLAFDFENLLLCAQVMNREEKRNFFPLHRDSVVASATNPTTWRNEIPVFLDPRKPDDVFLVEYDETGSMRPRTDLTEWEHLRVIVTNECFGLSRFQPLIEGRQRIWQKCLDLMEQYVRAASKQLAEGTPSPVLQQQKEDAMLELIKLLDPDEQFSSVAASCLSSSSYGWARNLASFPHSATRGRAQMYNAGEPCRP